MCSKKIRDLAGGLPLAVAAALLSGGNATKIEEAVIEALNSINLGICHATVFNISTKLVVKKINLIRAV